MESGFFKFILFRRKTAGCNVHLLLQIIRNCVIYKAACRLNIVYSILAVYMIRLVSPLVNSDHDHRRIVGKVLELAERRQIINSVPAYSGDPANRSWSYTGLKWI